MFLYIYGAAGGSSSSLFMEVIAGMLQSIQTAAARLCPAMQQADPDRNNTGSTSSEPSIGLNPGRTLFDGEKTPGDEYTPEQPDSWPANILI